MDLTAEQAKKARGAKSPDDLLALAGAEGLAMTDGEARDCFARLHPPVGELADEELEAVAGGGCGGGGNQSTPYPVGSAVGVIDEDSDIPGALICCMECRQTRFKVVEVIDYNVVQVGCEHGCKKAFRQKEGFTGFRYSDRISVSILSLKPL